MPGILLWAPRAIRPLSARCPVPRHSDRCFLRIYGINPDFSHQMHGEAESVTTPFRRATATYVSSARVRDATSSICRRRSAGSS